MAVVEVNEHEAAFIVFIRPEKRSRWRQLLQSAEGRKKLVDDFAHMGDLDMRFAVEIPSTWSASDIVRALRVRGAPSGCYVMSEHSSHLDEREMPLHEAIHMVYGNGFGTLVSCIPGRLCYFETEEPNDRYILER